MVASESIQTRVLIIGAGPVGLALAIELGHRKIPCLLVERNPRVGYAPRAKTTNVRTREHFRRWGIADQLRAASPLGAYYPSNVIFVTRLAGFELARFENAMYCAPGRNPLYSEHAQWIPQYAVEEVMRSHAAGLADVEIRFSSELIGFEQDAKHVRAQIKNVSTGAVDVVQSSFLVGADGARSTVRDAIGAKMQGTYGLSRNYNVVFRAPGLAERHPHGPGIMYWQVNDDVPSLIGPMDRGDTWFFMPTAVQDGFKFSPSEAPDLIRRATGIDLPYEVLSSDEWVASRLIADRYRDRRVFLAGDACHLHPPFGGYGMNMGIADGVDLGWKLSAVLQGWGGPKLLDSYELERRSVHNFVMDEAVANHALLSHKLWKPGMDGADEQGARLREEARNVIEANKIREFTTLGVVLGYRYVDSPIVVADGSSPPGQDFLNYVPSAHPGCLAPHVWMHDGTSLYDHFGQGFTLLVTDGSDNEEIERARDQARNADVPLTILRPREPAVADLYQARLVLIRPDQHVAWRGNAWPKTAAGVFDQVTGRTRRTRQPDRTDQQLPERQT